jgi:hypothetical protein
MRPALVPALLLPACTAIAPGPEPAAKVAPKPAAVATAPTQVWRGVLRCGPNRGLARLILVEPMEVRVTGNVARYGRAPPGQGGLADGWESGGGTVAPDGSLTLTGEAVAPSYRYSAQYSGVLPPAGDPTRLVGKQSWYSRRTSPVDRICSISLRRDG